MQERIKEALEWFWDLIEISEVLQKVYKVLSAMQNDFVFNLLWFIGMVFLALFSFFFAVKFDYQSTLSALDITREFIMQDSILPQKIAGVETVSLVLLAITLAPTLIEFFGAVFAKQQIRVVQIMVIAFSIFDVVTDIPTVSVFVNLHAPAIDSLGFPISWLAYIIFFSGWLLMATFGFELLLCIFVYAAIFFAGRLLKGGSGNAPQQQQYQQRRN